ncbi:MAG: hypothetical protein ACHQ7M_16555, partial [Chloroflexota bacterium]
KSDLEIIQLLAQAMGQPLAAADPDSLLQEIRTQVRGYAVSLAKLLTGESVLALPLNGRVPLAAAAARLRPNQDTLFTAGTLGRYSAAINAVLEARK